MKIELDEPLLIVPENIPLIINDEKITLRRVLLSIREVATVKNEQEREFYNSFIKSILDKETNVVDITQPKGALLQEWLYKTTLNAMVVNSIISLLNGEI